MLFCGLLVVTGDLQCEVIALPCIAAVQQTSCVLQVNGVYNAANVVQTDILTCGAGFLQLTDALLVPPNGASGGNHTVMASSATAG